MGPPKITEDAKTLAKSKIQSSQKSGEKVKRKRRNSLLDRIRKDAARRRLPISGQQSASPEKHFHPNPKEEYGVDTSGRSKMVNSEDDVPLIRKGSKEKVAATSTSHLNLKFINTPELPNIERRQRSRHSSWPLRKKTDNELGYDEGRNRNRHQHQQKRQNAYLAYKNKSSISSSASDWESD